MSEHEHCIELPVAVRRGIWSGGLHFAYWEKTPTHPDVLDHIWLVSEEGAITACLARYVAGSGVPAPRKG